MSAVITHGLKSIANLRWEAIQKKASESSGKTILQAEADTYIPSGGKAGIRPEDPEWVLDTMPVHSYNSVDDTADLSSSVYDTMRELCKEYYNGNKSEEEVFSYIKEAADTVFNHHVAMHRTTSNDVENKTKVLTDTWNKFRRLAVQGAMDASNAKGKELAQNVGNPNSRFFLYYNAEYQYQSEDLKTKALDYMQNLAKEQGLGDIDFPTSFGDDTCSESLFSSYNSAWNTDAALNKGCGTMFDTSIDPPKGFSFFFKHDRYSDEEKEAMLEKVPNNPAIFNGYLNVTWNGKSIEGSVPFTNGLSDGNGFNMYSLVQGFEGFHELEGIQSAENFLKNFDFINIAYKGTYWANHKYPFHSKV